MLGFTLGIANSHLQSSFKTNQLIFINDTSHLSLVIEDEYIQIVYS